MNDTTLAPPHPVLLIGATGETGQRVARLLLARGVRLRALRRSSAPLPEGIEPVAGDIRDPDAVSRACEGVHTIVSCLGNRRYYGEGGMHDVDVLGTRNLARAAAERGAQHIVLLSAFGLDRRSIFLTVFSKLLNRYFEHKALVEEAVRSCGVPFTLVRPHELRNRPRRGHPVLNQTEPLRLLQTVSRDTVAEVLGACVFEDRVKNAVFEVVEGGALPLDDQLDRLQRDGALHLNSVSTPLYC